MIWMKITHSGNISYFHTDEINDGMNMYNLWVETCTTENKHDCKFFSYHKKGRTHIGNISNFHEDEMNDCMNLCTV